MNNKSKLIPLVQGGLIAALYTVATLVLAPLSFGPVQFRASEALTVMPVFTASAVPGLAVGCAISNAVGAATGANIAGWLDVLLGSMATLMAAVCTRMLRKVEVKGIPLPALLPPVIFNALIVGAELSLFIPDGDPFWFCLLTVGAGELGVLLILGIPLIIALRKTRIFTDGSSRLERNA
ncbi:MAG: QueT transporter family protein [Clostridia bacterium]|nr:QueT transporter family protein [Clostridia bacterium]